MLDVTPAFNTSRVEDTCTPQAQSQHQQRETINGDSSHNKTVSSHRNNHKAPQEEEEDSDTVPASPPAKKSRFYFRRCFEATFNPDTLPGHNVILAEDSDEGD